MTTSLNLCLECGAKTRDLVHSIFSIFEKSPHTFPYKPNQFIFQTVDEISFFLCTPISIEAQMFYVTKTNCSKTNFLKEYMGWRLKFFSQKVLEIELRVSQSKTRALSLSHIPSHISLKLYRTWPAGNANY